MDNNDIQNIEPTINNPLSDVIIDPNPLQSNEIPLAKSTLLIKKTTF